MKTLRQVSLAFLIALVSLGLILGSFSLSLAEGGLTGQVTATQTQPPTGTATLQPVTPLVASATPSETPTPGLISSLTPSLTSSLSPTWTASLPASPTTCPHPAGWLPYVVQSGDTLTKIATRYRTSVAALQQANCLLATDAVLPGMVIYVPPLATQTPIPCGRPAGWVTYIVKPGDTLYRLSQVYAISVTALQQANCLGSSTLLHVGQVLYVPPWAPRLPTPTTPGVYIPTDTSIVVPTDTPASGLPTDIPTELPTTPPTEPPAPTATTVPVEIPTDTWTPTGP
jgi:LysM repeat protein